MSSQETVNKTELPFNQNIELQKIQILDGYCQTKFNARYALMTGGFIGLLIFYATLYYQGVFYSIFNHTIFTNTVVVTLFLLTTYAFIKSLNEIAKQHDVAMNQLNDLLVDVANERKLDSIPNLKKQFDAKKKFKI